VEGEGEVPVFMKHQSVKTHGRTFPSNVNLGTRLELTVSYTARPLYPRGNGSRYTLISRLDGASEAVWPVWRRKESLAPAANQVRFLSGPNVPSLHTSRTIATPQLL